jgi:hypothetical protein
MYLAFTRRPEAQRWKLAQVEAGTYDTVKQTGHL